MQLFTGKTRDPILFVCFILLVLIHTALYGQSVPETCQGSLGDPIVNIDFGSGPGFGPPLEAGVTTYFYVPQIIEHDGQYTLASNVNQAKPDWHVMEDHTPGDENGYMLVVNASNEPGEFYRRQVTVCQNTDFEFSAWIINANTPETCAGHAKRPNVLFRIEDLHGNRIDEVATGDIEPTAIPEWKQYGFTFNTGDETDFYLVMINNNPGGCGNDLAIDDITFRACGPGLTVTAEGLTADGMLYACPGATLDLESSISAGFDTPLYQWQVRPDDHSGWMDLPGEMSSSLRGVPTDASRQYRIVAANNPANLSSEFCRVVSSPARITVVPPLSVNRQPEDIAACLNETPFFEVQASGGYPAPDYRWEVSRDPAGPWAAALPAQTGTPSNRYYPPTDSPGEYYYRCRLTTPALGCAPLHTRAAKLTVLPPVVTLNLPVRSLCADDAPLLLEGGLPLAEGNDHPGVYLGPGVSGGYFDPRAAGGPGTYEITYTLRNTSGCQYLATDRITVHPAALAEAGPDKKMLEGTHVQLDGTARLSGMDDGNGDFGFSWSPATSLDDPAVPNPRASPPESLTYTLTVTTPNGCTATDTVRVQVLEKLVIPSAFTPNQDGVNDTWEIQGIAGYPNASINVFNRWGRLVFHSRGYPLAWDGTAGGIPLPPGVYYYLIDPGIFLAPISGSLSIIR